MQPLPAGRGHGTSAVHQETGMSANDGGSSQPAHRGVPLRLVTLLAVLLVSLPTAILSAPASAEPAPEPALLSTIGIPTLTVSGGTVQWHPIALENSYKLAISNEARGAANRVTTYLTLARVPGETQSYTPTLSPSQTVYVGISADDGETWSAQETTLTAPTPEQPKPEPEPSPSTPVLSVHGSTISWAATSSATSYKLAISNQARGAANRVTTYLTLARVPGETQSYTPTLSPSQTVYVGISADDGETWSAQETTLTAPTPEQPEAEATPPTPPVEEPTPPTPPTKEPEPILSLAAPALSVHGDTISWPAIPGATSYELATVLNPTTTRETTYKIVTATSITPPAVPGQTIGYGLAVNTLIAQGPWTEVSITYPAGAPSPPPTGSEPVTPPPPPVISEPPVSSPISAQIIGTNDGAGWGPAAAKTILGGHITWNRVEIGQSTNTLAQSLSDGFHVLAIVGNVDDGTPLSQVDPNSWGATVVSQLQANPGISIAEAGNEMFLKGNIANPVQYGRMYLAAVNAIKAAGIHTPLLFDDFGDYPLGSWGSPTSWSRDSTGGGWLHDAVANVPGLAPAILANGLNSHPYGAIGVNKENKDSYGTGAVAGQEAEAQAVLGATPTFYITEFGYDLSKCGVDLGACSQQEQATKMHEAYKIFLNDPHVAGIWWYQSHDDSTGQFGFMNNDNTTRPSFTTLTTIATEQGQ
jgi:hypothetical protein